jgi:DNA-binding NarL/FixJ family response regulator
MMMRTNLETEQGTIRVVLSSGSPMIGEALEAILEQEEDIEVVGKVTDPVDLLIAVAETRADVVIHSWPDSDQLPGICSHLLMEYPCLLIIGIPTTVDRMCVSRQVILTRSLPSEKPQDLLTQIRHHWPKTESTRASDKTT